MKKYGMICLILVILLFLSLALDLQNFGILTYGLGFIFTILAAFFFAKTAESEKK